MPPLNFEALQERLGESRSAALAVIATFTRIGPPVLAELLDAATLGECERARQLAHNLKGTLLWIGADTAAGAAAAIERDAFEANRIDPVTVARLRVCVHETLEAAAQVLALGDGVDSSNS